MKSTFKLTLCLHNSLFQWHDSGGELEYPESGTYGKMRPNVGALRFRKLMLAFDMVFPVKFSVYNTRQ